MMDYNSRMRQGGPNTQRPTNRPIGTVPGYNQPGRPDMTSKMPNHSITRPEPPQYGRPGNAMGRQAAQFTQPGAPDSSMGRQPPQFVQPGMPDNSFQRAVSMSQFAPQAGNLGALAPALQRYMSGESILDNRFFRR
jgi:hypothetical protein